MATVTRVNGLKATVATLYNDNCNLYKITVKVAATTAVDLRAEDDAVNEVVEQIVKEINPLAYFAVDANTGIIYVVMDKAINSAGDLQHRIRQIGSDTPATSTDGNATFTYSVTSVGPNDIDISGTTVEVAVSMAFGV